MRTLVWTAVLLMGSAAVARAQMPLLSGDAALTYHWVHTNTPAGQCGCFDINGGGLSASMHLILGFSAVGEFSSEQATNILSSGKSLTLTTYLVGARYTLNRLWPKALHGPQPFVQALVGAGHAGGGIAAAGDGTTSFATRVGGGLDLPIAKHIAVRGQADFFLTQFNNTTNNRQTNALIGGGLVYRWGK